MPTRRQSSSLSPKTGRRRWRVHWQRIGFVVILVASAVLVARFLPNVRIAIANRAALAQIQLSGSATHIRNAVLITPKGSIGLSVRSGDRLWPHHPVPAGAPATIKVTVQGPWWLLWLPADTRRVSARVITPADPRLAIQHETILAGQPVEVALKSAATAVQGPSLVGQSRVIRGNIRADQDVDWGTPADNNNTESGTLTLETQARPWEAMSTPQTLVWHTVTSGSVLRLQQLLAQLGFLPLSWRPASHTEIVGGIRAHAGIFTWRYRQVPAALQTLWQPSRDTVMTAGALFQFEHQHSLPLSSNPGLRVWTALLAALHHHQVNRDGYSYVTVSENRPETLTLWHDGAVVLTSLVNTAKPPGHTHIGTFPIFLRYRQQSMRGTEPGTGQPYFYPDVPWVNYFKGNDAIHGFSRAAYGFPQSAGCVEMPIAKAAIAYRYMHYGTLVTVTPPTSS